MPTELKPFTPPSFPLRIEASAQIVNSIMELRFIVSGDFTDVLFPSEKPTARRNELWKHTCMEAFVTGDSDEYVEINLSPSGEWNVYHFDRYREGMRDEPMKAAPEIRVSETRDVWTLEARLALPPLSGELRAGITAVIEDRNGESTYWALKHAGKQADFHLRESFVLELSRMS